MAREVLAMPPLMHAIKLTATTVTNLSEAELYVKAWRLCVFICHHISSIVRTSLRLFPVGYSNEEQQIALVKATSSGG